MSFWLLSLAPLALLGYALVGGVFLAFSDFLMRAFAKSAGGVEVMQVVNREVFRWVFMALFLGLTPVSLALLAGAAASIEAPGHALFAAAGGLYVLGCFAVTAGRNVPLNEALARMDADGPEAERFWRETYLPRWGFWNRLRAIACAAAAALTLAGLIQAHRALAALAAA
ncbi:MAG: anthrone oxygenase family protein, partial [Pseudomonadota bacterium]